MTNSNRKKFSAAKRSHKVLTKQSFVAMLNARREMKYYTDNDETTVAANGAIGPMSQPIVVGDTADSRDGNQISVSELELNLTLALNASATSDTIRFIVFADMQSNSVYPTVTDVIVAADPNAIFTRSVRVTKRFKILHDVLLTLTSVGSNRIVIHRKRIKTNHVVTYNGTTSVESANGRGAVYYLICGDETTNLTAYNLDWAVSFYDS